MADHYYAVAAASQTTRRQRSDIIVGTSTTAGTNPIELRVQDGAVLSARQVAEFCRFLGTLAASRDFQVIVPGTLG
jgi:hypothetical protein